MGIRRRKSQIGKSSSMESKKRLDERIKQHVQRFRLQINNDNSNNDNNNNNLTRAVTNNLPTPISRDLTPTPPPVERLHFISDLLPPGAFIHPIDPNQSIRGLTSANQTVPSSLVQDQPAQNYIDPLAGIDFTNTGQAVPNGSSALEMAYGQNIDNIQMEMANQQQQGHQQQQMGNHPHGLQRWDTNDELLAIMNPLSITTPVLQLNHQPVPLSTTAPQIVTQKPHKTPSRPNPPTFENGPSYVIASPDLVLLFRDFDTDGSGAISFDELQLSLTNREASKSRYFNSEVITVLIEMFDNNNDGMIDVLEFPEMLAYLANWNSCFMFLDEDHSGMLEYHEMHHAVSAMGLTISHSLMRDIMAKYEYTAKNKIDLDNFILCCVTLYRFKETYEFMMETGGATCKHIGLEEFLRTMLLSSGTMQSLKP